MSCAPCYTSRSGPKFQWPVVADEFKEYIDIPILQGSTNVEVPFTVAKASDQIVHHALIIYNSADEEIQAVIPFNITRIDALGISLLLQAPTPTPNYRVRGLVSILP